ncbi:hypothetical protein ElyMa_002007000 [Elysia marginata]|uniref:Uncharacterized protein n=1 Tax=Elysia marginata TaxID=1093978 RepID=A0AAV4F5S6_9GAST|nr:hypothetical protein ElyMa_002007000 [Elysia marginata]
MTKPKRKKHNNTQSDVSDVSGVLESELLIRIEALEEKVEECARQNTQRILDELERVRGQVHSLNLENETLRKELKELREDRAILVEEAPESAGLGDSSPCVDQRGEIFAKDHNGVVTKINNDEDIHQVNTRLGRSNRGTWMRGRGGDNIASVPPKTYTKPSQSKNGDKRESNTVSSEAGSASGDVTTPSQTQYGDHPPACTSPPVETDKRPIQKKLVDIAEGGASSQPKA